MAHKIEDAVLQTLILLDFRLKRVAFILHGQQDDRQYDTKQQPSVSTRLAKLEQSLQKLMSQSDVVSDIVQLQRRQPQILSVGPTSAVPSADQPTTTQALTTVLAAAPALQSTASQLRAMSDLAPPPTAAFASLVSLGPRIDAAAQRQMQQELEIAELRKRSAKLVVRWHEVNVQSQMRCWADWETRLRKIEREIRRRERRQIG